MRVLNSGRMGKRPQERTFNAPAGSKLTESLPAVRRELILLLAFMMNSEIFQAKETGTTKDSPLEFRAYIR